jgi:hypothetical protein
VLERQSVDTRTLRLSEVICPLKNINKCIESNRSTVRLTLDQLDPFAVGHYLVQLLYFFLLSVLVDFDSLNS